MTTIQVEQLLVERIRALGRGRWALCIALALLLPVAAVFACWEIPGVSQVFFSSDGKILAAVIGTTFADRGEVKLVDVASGRERTVIREPYLITAAALHPDGKTLATATLASLKLWDTTTGQELITLASPPDGQVRVLAFSPDGNTLAAGFGGSRGRITLWDMTTRQRRIELDHGSDLYTLAFSPDGNSLAATSAEALKLWNVGPGPEQSDPRLELPGGHTLAFSPSGDTLASYDFNCNLKLWDPGTGQLRSSSRRLDVKLLDPYTDQLRSPPPGPSHIGFTKDGTLILMRGIGSEIHVSNLTSREILPSLEGHTLHVNTVAISADGQTIASGSQDTTARLWSVAGGRLARLPRPRVVRAHAAFPWLSLSFLAVSLVWCVAWVRTGAAKQPASQPLWDLLLIASIALGGLILRVSITGSLDEFSRPTYLLLASMLGSMFSLLAVWAVFGDVRWSLRLPGLLAGLVILAALPILALKREAHIVWLIVIAGVCQVTSLLFLMNVAWWFGARIVRADSSVTQPDVATPKGKRQFSLHDMAIWIAAAALFFGLARLVEPVGMPWLAYVFAVYTGVTLSLAAVTGVVATLTSWPPVLRLVAFGLIASGCGVMYDMLFRRVGLPDPWWWPVGLAPLLACFVAAALGVFRVHGFRLRLGQSVQP